MMMTQDISQPAPGTTRSLPFRRILVPYDGSESSERALAFAIALGRGGAELDIVFCVDESAVISQSATAVAAFDPTPIIDAIDKQGGALLDLVGKRCRAVGIKASTRLLHERPVSGIIGIAARNNDQLIVLGTHARTGLARTFLGSTTEGVLRSGTTPILAVRATMEPPKDQLFQRVLVAVDESDPADAAVALAAGLSHALGSQCLLCGVVDTGTTTERVPAYGYPLGLAADEMRAQIRDILDHACVHGGFAPGTVKVALLEGEPIVELLAEALRIGADLIVIGSHGRRGLQRLLLGSVAEYVVRRSPIPVLVVRSSQAWRR